MTVSLRNPFTNRNAVRCQSDFFGRRAELREIYSRVINGQSVSLVGERRMGKSSILQALKFANVREELDVPDRVLVIHADAQFSGTGTSDEFLTSMCGEISAATSLDTDEDGRVGLEQLLDDATRERLQIVVAIDEFDVLVGNEAIPTPFFAYLRSLSSRYRVAFAIASREGSVAELVRSKEVGSSFLNIFGSVYVGPLEAQDARALLVESAAREGVDFTEQDIELVLTLAGYQPILLQIGGYHLFNLKLDAPSGASLEAVLRQRFLFEAYMHLDYLCERLTPLERKAILQVEAGAAIEPLEAERLAGRGLLVRTATGWRPFSSVFPEMLQVDRVQVVSPPKWLGRILAGFRS